MNAIHRTLTALAAFLAAAAAAATTTTISHEGRLLRADGSADASATRGATVACYVSADASEPYATSATTISTDANGDFAVLLPVTLPESGVNEMWFGITPEGGSEIVPRTRVSAAPYVVRAASAAVISAPAVSCDGLTVESFESEPSLSAETAVVNGSLKVASVPDGVVDLAIDTLAADGGSCLSLMRRNSGDYDTAYWDHVSADAEISLTATTGFFSFDYNEEKSCSVSAAADGFACFYIRAHIEHDNLSDYYAEATITVGNATYISSRKFGNGNKDDDDKKCRAIVIPVRAGETATLKLKNHRDLVTYDVRSWGKLAMYYFGSK